MKQVGNCLLNTLFGLLFYYKTQEKNRCIRTNLYSTYREVGKIFNFCLCTSIFLQSNAFFFFIQVIKFNIYSPNASSTSSKVTCNSSLCETQSQCTSATSNCPYQVRYVSQGTSSTGFLVEDVLHLITNDNKPKAVNPRITFG